MTIAELGSLGELIAAVATVATLAYLAIQIRANTIVTKSEADRASRAETIETVRLIASSEELTRIFAEGCADPESLNPLEQVRFRFLLSGFIGPLTAAYKEWQLGIADEAELLERLQQSRAVFASPGGQWYWRDRRENYDPAQREYFDSHLS